MVNPRNKVHIQFIALYWCITEKHSKWLKRQLKLYFFCTKYKRSVLVRLEDNGVKHSTQALDNIWCHHYFYAFLKMALGILIKIQRRIWFEVLSRVRTSQLDWTPNGSFREFLAWENSRHLAWVAWRFWSGAQTSQGGRGQRNCEVFYFSRCFAARSRAFAASPLSGTPNKTAMLHRLRTFGGVTNGFRR